MEDFVKGIVRSSDLNLLTKKMIRRQYCEHIGKSALSSDEKTEINTIIDEMIVKMIAEKAAMAGGGGGTSPLKRSKEKENRQPLSQVNGDSKRAKAGSTSSNNLSDSPRGKLAKHKGSNDEHHKKHSTDTFQRQMTFDPNALKQMNSPTRTLTDTQTLNLQSSPACEGANQPVLAVKPRPQKKLKLEEVVQIILSCDMSSESSLTSEEEEEEEAREVARPGEDSDSSPFPDSSKKNNRGKTDSSAEECSDEDSLKPKTEKSKKRGHVSESESEVPRVCDTSDEEGNKIPRPQRKRKGRKIVHMESSDSEDKFVDRSSEGETDKVSLLNDTSTSEDEVLASVQQKQKEKKPSKKCVDRGSSSKVGKNVQKRKKTVASDSDDFVPSTGKRRKNEGASQKLAGRLQRKKREVTYCEDSDSDWDAPVSTVQLKSKAKGKGTKRNKSVPSGDTSETEVSKADKVVTAVGKKSKRRETEAREQEELDEENSDSEAPSAPVGDLSSEDSPGTPPPKSARAGKRCHVTLSDDGIATKVMSRSGGRGKKGVKSKTRAEKEAKKEESVKKQKVGSGGSVAVGGKSRHRSNKTVSDSSNSEDVPLRGKKGGNKSAGAKNRDASGSDSEEVPLKSRNPNSSLKVAADDDDSSDTSDSDDVPLKARKSGCHGNSKSAVASQGDAGDVGCLSDIAVGDQDVGSSASGGGSLAQSGAKAGADSGSGTSDSDVPLARRKNTPDFDSDSDFDLRGRKRVAAVSDSDDNDLDAQRCHAKDSKSHRHTSGEVPGPVSDSSSDTDSSDSDLPLAKRRTTVKQNSGKRSKVPPSKKQKAKPSTKPKAAQPSRESSQLRSLRKICREVGIILRNTIELKGCETEAEKMDRIKDLLKNVGMRGEPTMKKAAAIKLKKEAAELNVDNIITSNSGAGRPRRGQKQPVPPKVPTVSPGRSFAGLKGIVDSEGSESD